MSYKSQIHIHFDEADPAGIAFFGNIFHKIHQTYEDFLRHMDIDLKEWFLNPQTIAPIRHTEAEYLAPLLPFETYDVVTKVLSLSESTFRLEFTIEKKNKKHVIVSTTHVCCSVAEMKKVPIPKNLKLQLEKFL